MGQQNRAYCYEAVLGERVPVPACPTVRPTGTPTVTRPAATNDCLPAAEVVNWDVISVDANNWGVCVRSLAVSGDIKIRPWPSDPTRMVVPNTANPVDGGNINNTAGSNNHWQHAIDDMADYDTAGSGGAGPHWHSTAASEAHEWAHWHQDYLSDSVTSAAGGDWGTANTDLNSLRQPKASSPTVAAATAALRPRADARIATFIAAVTARWNQLISTTDSPGSGGRGYAAGASVLSRLIGAVRTYKDSKGW